MILRFNKKTQHDSSIRAVWYLKYSMIKHYSFLPCQLIYWPGSWNLWIKFSGAILLIDLHLIRSFSHISQIWPGDLGTIQNRFGSSTGNWKGGKVKVQTLHTILGVEADPQKCDMCITKVPVFPQEKDYVSKNSGCHWKNGRWEWSN